MMRRKTHRSLDRYEESQERLFQSLDGLRSILEENKKVSERLMKILVEFELELAKDQRRNNGIS